MVQLTREAQEKLVASGGRFRFSLRQHVRAGQGGLHMHPEVELVLHLTGRGHVSLGTGDAKAFDSPSVDVCGPGVPHSQAQTEEGEDLCVHLAVDADTWGDLAPLLHTDRVSTHMIGEFVDLTKPTHSESPLVRASLSLRATALWFAVLCNVAEDTCEGAQVYVHRACSHIEVPGKNVRAKSRLNRAILAQGWGEFFRQLDYKLAWSGGWLVAVPPQNTSRTCPRCDHVAKGNRLTQARFVCGGS